MAQDTDNDDRSQDVDMELERSAWIQRYFESRINKTW